MRTASTHRVRLQVECLESRQLLSARVLVFSRTAGFRHDAIPEGIAAVRAIGQANDFTVDATEDPTAFTAANLAQYQAVVFLLTTGDVLNRSQEMAFEGYIQAGGGYVGIHSAADTEYDWAWYGQLMGAYFAGHPAIQTADSYIEDHYHPATFTLPGYWPRADEWYNYRTNPRDDGATVLAVLDEGSYQGGTMGTDHPITWYKYFDGGRSWYTGMGHTEETYQEPLFREHLAGGLRFALGEPLYTAGLAVAPTQIDVGWTDFSLDPSFLYVLGRSMDGVNYEAVDVQLAPAFGFADTGLAPGTTYAYQLYAITFSGNLLLSNVTWVTTPDGDVPFGGGPTGDEAALVDLLRPGRHRGRPGGVLEPVPF